MDFSMVDFNYFDVIIGSIVLILGIKGFIHGFIKEVFGLLGLVGGIYLASRYSGKATTFIAENFLQIEDSAIANLIGFLATLLAVWLVATMVGAMFSKLSSESSLGFIDRILGFIVGGGKYFLIFALIITALSNVKLVRDNLEQYFESSILYPFLYETGSYLIDMDTSSLGLSTSDKDANVAVAKD
jgi:membrane protein required for colicin V production